MQRPQDRRTEDEEAQRSPSDFASEAKDGAAAFETEVWETETNIIRNPIIFRFIHTQGPTLTLGDVATVILKGSSALSVIVRVPRGSVLTSKS